MKLKKFEAATEQKAIEMVKNELGLDALILNIRKVKPQGLSAVFRKPYVQVTAAYEDNPIKRPEVPTKAEDTNEKKSVHSGQEFNEAIQERLREAEENLKVREKDKDLEILELEKKINHLQELLDKTVSKLAASEHSLDSKRIYDNNLLQFFYDTLVGQEVLPGIAEELLKDIENIDDIDILDINLIVKMVYNRIIEIIGQSKGITPTKKGKFANNIVFIGPTGVGKTTTIAKVSSDFIINQGLKVAFVTGDTYRIAAVEQLKTYAEILDCEVGVAYNYEDLKSEIYKLRAINDLIFIDTAGRSHKNKETIEELKSFLGSIESADIYLVLSITTKYEDLISIINAYAEFTKFKIIFTKLDETSCLGSILNIRKNTDFEIAYVSVGQNVPDDIEVIKPEKIAKALLGSMYK